MSSLDPFNNNFLTLPLLLNPFIPLPLKLFFEVGRLDTGYSLIRFKPHSFSIIYSLFHFLLYLKYACYILNISLIPFSIAFILFLCFSGHIPLLLSYNKVRCSTLSYAYIFTSFEKHSFLTIDHELPTIFLSAFAYLHPFCHI